MEQQTKKSVQRWVRSLHRDIGFFVLGLTVIYCVSGILLTYKQTDLLKTETSIEKTISPGLSANTLSKALHLRQIKVVSEDQETIQFDAGTYNKITGEASYTGKEFYYPLNKFIELHSTSNKNSIHLFTVFYAALLAFLAISSFWMYKPGSKFFKRGIITAGMGIGASLALMIL